MFFQGYLPGMKMAVLSVNNRAIQIPQDGSGVSNQNKHLSPMFAGHLDFIIITGRGDLPQF